MSKKLMVEDPWRCPARAVPQHSNRVLLKYINKDRKDLICVGWFDPSTGWVLHDSMRLPDGWKVYFWMEIPEPPPF